jgi:hypothetical protein
MMPTLTRHSDFASSKPRQAGLPNSRSNSDVLKFINVITVGDTRAFPFLTVVTGLVITQCVMLPAPSSASTPPDQSQPAQGQISPACREFTIPVTVGGQQQQAVGEACQQPDGSWRITQNTPGLPSQVYTLPPPPIYTDPYPYQYYYGADPWSFGPPFFAGGAIFFGDGFREFHDRDDFRHERFHDGFHERNHDGFHARFHDGFHGGFHGAFHGGGGHVGGGHGGGGHGGGGHR